ncbi:MAG: SAP domain-containing protein [Verrucomicrobiales bacterium]|nr:SAP domain-containing protein [Verrucomicrobiales bacterium]
MKSEHFSDLLRGMTLFSTKKEQHHQPYVAESEAIAKAFRSFGSLQLQDFLKWINKSFRTRDVLIRAIDTAAKTGTVPRTLIEDIKNSDTGSLKSVCQHFGIKIAARPTKGELSLALENFIKKKIGIPKENDRNKAEGVAYEIARIKAILADDLTKSKLVQFDLLTDLLGRFDNAEAMVHHVEAYSRANATTAEGFYYVNNCGNVEKKILGDLLPDFSVPELKKLAGIYQLPKTGSKDSLVKRIMADNSFPECAPDEVVKLACEAFSSIHEKVGYEMTVEEAWDELPVSMGIFTAKTIKSVADANGITVSGNRAKMISTLGDHLRRLAVNRTRG